MHSKWIFNQIDALQIKKKINLLDFASGNGRNSIPLSNKNFIVTAIDKDQEKLNKYENYNNINTIPFDLETEKEWPLPREFFDVIIVVNYLYRPNIKKLIDLLKKDGFLFYETFSFGNEKYGSPKNPDFLLKDGELLDIFENELVPLSFYNGKIIGKNISIKQRASFIKKTSYYKDALFKKR
jgi:2-polyprenyl-3-methyl-5-hydroxy-6-metoxy-1,4-benzoquinol methylase